MVSQNIVRQKFKRLFFDIETSPNIGFFWRAGYKLNIGPDNIIHERAIICICWKWEHEKKVHYLKWDNNQCDKQMLIDFMETVNEASQIVGHNGDRYDLAFFRTRCIYHAIELSPYIDTVDTLKIARSQLFMFNSNKLDYLGKFLKVGEKIDTGGFGLWTSIVLAKCEKSMNKMVKYCKQDVLLLEKVFKRLMPYSKHGIHKGVYEGGEKWECPGCGTTNVNSKGPRVTAKGIITRRMKCLEDTCKQQYVVNNTVWQDYLDYRNSLKGDPV